jgi:hypothetical protein
MSNEVRSPRLFTRDHLHVIVTRDCSCHGSTGTWLQP